MVSCIETCKYQLEGHNLLVERILFIFLRLSSSRETLNFVARVKSNETNVTELSGGTVYYAVQGGSDF